MIALYAFVAIVALAITVDGFSVLPVQTRALRLAPLAGASTESENLAMTEEQRKLIDVSKSVLDTVGDDIQILPPTDGVKRIVMKFGGSSIANPERITYVTKLIKKHVDMGYRPIIICSAMGKTTNTLVSAGDFALQGQVLVDSLRTMHIGTATALGLPESTLRSLSELLDNLERLLEGVKNIGELTPRTMDALISFGERMSIRIVAGNLNKLGVPAQPFDSWTLGMLTTSDFGNAEVLPESYANIGDNLRKFDGSIVPVITGFIGKDKEGRITTLGRGGSDLSATVVGAACPADEVQVWKDVDGIMTADPRLVKGALPVDAVTYEEAAELAFFGAEVLHPISMQPAIASKIPVRVKNSYNPMAVGTVISASRDKTGTLVTAITSKNKVKLIDLVSTRMLGQYGFLAKVFSIFELCKASVDVVASSDVSLSLTLDTKGTADEAKLLALLKGIAQVEVFEERAIISLICNLDRSSEVMSIAFKVLEELGITVEMLSQGASKVNISLVVQMAQRERVIKALHARFFE